MFSYLRLPEFLSTPSARRATFAALCDIEPMVISIHALREEGDAGAAAATGGAVDFYPRPPRGGRPCRTYIRQGHTGISIHALREEGDSVTESGGTVRQDFYPRPPRGGRRKIGLATDAERYFYPRPPRGGRPSLNGDHAALQKISIHALREEGDLSAEMDHIHRALFLSTPSARRATCKGIKPSYKRVDFYPRPPRGGRPVSITRDIVQSDISIHALREEGDEGSGDLRPGLCLFLSTPSARRATQLSGPDTGRHGISIHALREEGDGSVFCGILGVQNFYPRPPRGGRPPSPFALCSLCLNFYPRPPRGGRPSVPS